MIALRNDFRIETNPVRIPGGARMMAVTIHHNGERHRFTDAESCVSFLGSLKTSQAALRNAEDFVNSYFKNGYAAFVPYA